MGDKKVSTEKIIEMEFIRLQRATRLSDEQMAIALSIFDSLDTVPEPEKIAAFIKSFADPEPVKLFIKRTFTAIREDMIERLLALEAIRDRKRLSRIVFCGTDIA